VCSPSDVALSLLTKAPHFLRHWPGPETLLVAQESWSGHDAGTPQFIFCRPSTITSPKLARFAVPSSLERIPRGLDYRDGESARSRKLVSCRHRHALPTQFPETFVSWNHPVVDRSRERAGDGTPFPIDDSWEREDWSEKNNSDDYRCSDKRLKVRDGPSQSADSRALNPKATPRRSGTISGALRLTATKRRKRRAINGMDPETL
jgi:hypothetical protein